MTKVRITRQEIDAYKREVLETSVLVRLDEAAAILAVSTDTVRRRVEEGRLTPYNDNHTRKGIRFLASELQNYVREMRQELWEE
jgi:excisionase family DNA binding protein